MSDFRHNFRELTQMFPVNLIMQSEVYGVEGEHWMRRFMNIYS